MSTGVNGHVFLSFTQLLYYNRLKYILNFFLQLEMEDEDTIDVFQQQTGGSSL